MVSKMPGRRKEKISSKGAAGRGGKKQTKPRGKGRGGKQLLQGKQFKGGGGTGESNEKLGACSKKGIRLSGGGKAKQRRAKQGKQKRVTAQGDAL